jgi:hypothetical protein
MTEPEKSAQPRRARESPTPEGLRQSSAFGCCSNDVPVDLVVAPERVIPAQGRRAKPRGIQWAELSGEQLAAMPPLVRLAPARAR